MPPDNPLHFVFVAPSLCPVFSLYQITPAMKKLTGPAILAALLMGHIGFLVATEESYTFRTSEYPAPHPGAEKSMIKTAAFNTSAKPAAMLPAADVSVKGF